MGSDPLTADDGTAINVGKVVWTSLAVLAGAVFGGAADIVESFFQAFLINPVNGIADYLSAQITGSYGVITQAANGVWAPTIRFAGDFGIFGFAIGIAFVLVIAYIFARGWTYA